MEEQLLFEQNALVRKMTLKEFEDVTEENADEIPLSFRNNIRWNLGHIYVVQQSLLRHYGGIDLEVDERYEQYFAPGTSPADWEEEPPSLEDIKAKLTAQPAILEEPLGGRLAEEAKKPFIGQKNIGQIFTFTLYHEGLHVSTMKAYKNIVTSK